MAFQLSRLASTSSLQKLFSSRFFDNFLPIPAGNHLQYGQRPADFELLDVSRNHPVKLSDYWGRKPVVLAFTRIFTEEHYCPLCFPHIQALNEAYKAFQARGAEVLMITSTDAAQSQQVVADLNLKMPLLCNPDCRVFRAYYTGQALGAPLPAQFVLDRYGRLRFRHLFSFLSSNASIATLLREVERLYE